MRFFLLLKNLTKGMKKRFLAVLLSVMMTLTSLSTTVFANGGGNVAYIGGTGYPSLGAAVNAAQPGETITLSGEDSTRQRITIDQDLSIELDGNSLLSAALKISGGTVTISDRRETGVINGNQAPGFEAAGNRRCSSSIYITGMPV